MARKTFSMHLQNSTASGGSSGDAAALALAFAAAEAERKADGFQPQALHVLCWLATRSGPFIPLKQTAKPPSADRYAPPQCLL